MDTFHTGVDTFHTDVDTFHTDVDTFHTEVDMLHAAVEMIHTRVDICHTILIYLSKAGLVPQEQGWIWGINGLIFYSSVSDNFYRIEVRYPRIS